MANKIKIARRLVTIPAAFLVVGPPLIDLDPSHIFNPLWTGHARLHTVWLISTNSLVSLIALGLLWQRGAPDPRGRVLFASGLVACVLGGFFIAAATQTLYGGSLSDPNGVAIMFGPLDANLTVFSILICLPAIAALIVRRPGP